MNHNTDPRVKFLLVLALSTMVIFYRDISTLLLVTLVTLMVAKLMGVKLLQVVKRLRHFMILIFGLVVIQSIFRHEGTAIVSFGNITILTDMGIKLAVGFFCRVVVIIYSGAMIGTSSLRENLQGLSQIGVPFELGLMTGVGIRFLPMLMEEVSNAYLAMTLRGVEVKTLPLKKRVTMISQLFIPIIYGTLIRAQRLSESIEARGFVIGQKRSSYYHLKFSKNDYVISGAVVVTTIVAMILHR